MLELMSKLRHSSCVVQQLHVVFAVVVAIDRLSLYFEELAFVVLQMPLDVHHLVRVLSGYELKLWISFLLVSLI